MDDFLRNTVVCSSLLPCLLTCFKSHANMNLISRVIKLFYVQKLGLILKGRKRFMPSVKLSADIQKLNLHENA